jgi:hypothetical protein
VAPSMQRLLDLLCFVLCGRVTQPGLNRGKACMSVVSIGRRKGHGMHTHRSAMSGPAAVRFV